MTARSVALRRQRGLSLAEALAAVVLIAITVVPAGDALRVALQSSAVSEDVTVQGYRLRGRLEEVLAEPFAVLAASAAGPATPTAYSDFAGSAERRLIYIAPYDIDDADGDGDPFTGGEADLLWIEARIAGRPGTLSTLKGQP